MSATSKHSRQAFDTREPRAADPRVVRTRTAVAAAARTLFLRDGYAGTTMEAIAEHAGLTKRTVYNNYADKSALFTQIVEDVITYSEEFSRGLHEEFTVGITAENLETSVQDLGRRLATGIVRKDVVALRRLLISEARAFPALATSYFERAPGQVLEALARGFMHLSRRRLLRIGNAQRAAAQFAYLVAGEPLDRAMGTGIIPSKRRLVACARDGVETFLSRYAMS